MTRAGFVWRELGRTIRKHPGTVFGSWLALALLFLLLCLFWITALTADQYYQAAMTDLTLDVFLTEDVPDSTLPVFADALGQLPGIRQVSYISRQQARQDLAALVGVDLLVGYDTLNPLPRSFVISLQPEYRNLRSLIVLESSIAQITGVDNVQYSRQWLEQVEQTRLLVIKFGIGLGVLIVMAALISSANSLRLMSRARATGLQQIRLLGGGKLFVAAPFLLEGGFISLAAAACGWLVIPLFTGSLHASQFTIVLPPLTHILVFCGGAGVLGAASAYFGIRKVIR